MTAQSSFSSSEPSTARPLTAHPLFPTGIGVWFAVLFSLSSLAIRGSLLEALVVVTHIDYLIPAATPPLGAVPRAIMALLIAALGYHVGRKVGLRIAQGEADATRTVSEPVYGAPPHDYGQDYAYPGETAPRRPFQVHEAVGGHYPGVYGAGEYAADPAAAAAQPWGHDAASAYQAQYAGQYAGEYQQPYPAHDAHEAYPHQTYHQEPQPLDLGQAAAYGAQHWPSAPEAVYPAEVYPAAAFAAGPIPAPRKRRRRRQAAISSPRKTLALPRSRRSGLGCRRNFLRAPTRPRHSLARRCSHRGRPRMGPRLIFSRPNTLSPNRFGLKIGRRRRLNSLPPSMLKPRCRGRMTAPRRARWPRGVPSLHSTLGQFLRRDLGPHPRQWRKTPPSGLLTARSKSCRMKS